MQKTGKSVPHFQLDHYRGIEQRPMGDIVRGRCAAGGVLTSHLIGQA